MTTNANAGPSLSDDDLLLVNNALNEVLNGPDAIDEWEFQLRLWVERRHAVDLLARLGRVLDGRGRH